MITAPPNFQDERRKEAQQVVVLLGPDDGTKPELKHEVDWLVPQRLGLYANGGRDDVLLFHVDMKKAKKRLIDTTMPVGYHRQIEVRLLDDQDEPTRVLSWGFIARQPQVINDQAESVTIEARLDENVFGVPLTQIPVYGYTFHLIGGDYPDFKYINRNLVFNPEIDEVIEGNMSDREYEESGVEEPTPEGQRFRYVLDPEECRRPSGLNEFDDKRELWTLSEAVLMLCWTLNAEEKFILNPTRSELQEAFKERDDLVRNIEIPFGSSLPAALDRLLVPAEFGWYLYHSLNADKKRETRMRFYARGKGMPRQVYMQKPGEVKTLKKTNVDEFNATYSIVDLANQIQVWGDFVKRESTFALQPAWSEEDDDLDLADLEKGQPTAIAKPFVGRKWVLNEAGDYSGLRLFNNITDLSGVFGSSQQYRRRKFLPCISQKNGDETPESNRFFVEWWDQNADGAVDAHVSSDPGWTKVKWPYSVLEKECGIVFEGSTPPEEMWALFSEGSGWYLRITATIAGDRRLLGRADRRDQSPNGLDVALVLDKSTKFVDRKIAPDSKFFGTTPNLERDDTDRIQEYAEDIRDIEDAAQVSCSIVLEGIDHAEFQLGNLIDKVDGRNLDLDGYVENAEPFVGPVDPDQQVERAVKPRRPQVVGLNYQFAGCQRLELLLESFKQERPELMTLKKK